MAKTTNATTHPPSGLTIPPEAFYQPTPEEVERNQGYYNGYSSGKACTPALPSPAGSGDYATYRIWCEPLLLPPATGGWVNNEAVGFNNAMIDGLNWLWKNDPNSPYRIPPK